MVKHKTISKELEQMAVDLYHKVGSGHIVAKKLAIAAPTIKTRQARKRCLYAMSRLWFNKYKSNRYIVC